MNPINTPIQSFARALCDKSNTTLLTGILRGVEKESLRTTVNHTVSAAPHPQQLGSALTHPQITTDFSEALMEFITPPSHQRTALLEGLQEMHRFAYDHLGKDLLWCNSMPCQVNSEADIPIAQYGRSNRGQMKTVYRTGLSYRYGRTMQAVAGLHYNFSLPKTFWAYLHQYENSVEDLNTFTTRRYFDLIRNFRRYYWLLLYLFGASPVMSRSFVDHRKHHFERLPHDNTSLYLPYATALRMGDLGYQSKAQEQLFVCYNSRSSYVQTLVNAINTPLADYESIGLTDKHGEYKQLNTGILQIENEFYSAIRPKRRADAGETALSALCQRGVEYVEVRCLDLDPFEPLGFSKLHSQFLDTFLLYCLLKESPSCDLQEFKRIQTRHTVVVNEGRKPGLNLENNAGEPVRLTDWGLEILQDMEAIANILDMSYGTNEHSKSLSSQKTKIIKPDTTPSAKVIQTLLGDQLSFINWAHSMSTLHRNEIMNTALDKTLEERFEIMASESWRLQGIEEQQMQVPFNEYLGNYYSQYECCNM